MCENQCAIARADDIYQETSPTPMDDFDLVQAYVKRQAEDAFAALVDHCRGP